VAVRVGNENNASWAQRFGHSCQYAASLEIPRGGPEFYKPRKRALYEIDDLG